MKNIEQVYDKIIWAKAQVEDEKRSIENDETVKTMAETDDDYQKIAYLEGMLSAFEQLSRYIKFKGEHGWEDVLMK